MKQTLQLKLGQQLTMTPQLQQAIRLLQLSTVDLQQEIQTAIDSNPLLEMEEEERYTEEGEDSAYGEEAETRNGEEKVEWQEDIPENLSVDADWEATFQNHSSAYGSPSHQGGDEMDPDERNSAQETLRDRLYWQLNLTPLVESDHAIAMAIIDAVLETGFLGVPPEELFQSLVEGGLDVDFEEFEAVRKLIQQFDPVGVASRDLRECLLVQLEQFPPRTPFLQDARLVVDRYLPLLGTHDYAQLKKRTGFRDGRLRECIELIRRLTPHPGDIIYDGKTEYIIPDVFITRREGRWHAELNPDCDIRLRIHSGYASMIRRADNSSDNTYLRNQLQEARWFIKSLESRNETLLKVARRIIELQQGFLDFGEEAMVPLVLRDIADSIGMHESTVSRVTNRKYMHTPRGIFELKHFFSSHVSTSSGGECSSTAIRAMVKKLITGESSRKPLSDSKIADMLCKEGINVARRTVAKYREGMAIPPSNERKRLS